MALAARVFASNFSLSQALAAVLLEPAVRDLSIRNYIYISIS